jgi:hypothetical protein
LGIRKLNRTASQSLTGAAWSATIGSSVRRIAVDGRGIPWVVHENLTIERRTTNNPTTGSWETLVGLARDIAAGPISVDDSGVQISYTYILGQDSVGGGNSVWVWNEQSAGDGGPAAPFVKDWYPLEGGGTTISVGPDGNPWLTNDANDIFRRVR